MTRLIPKHFLHTKLLEITAVFKRYSLKQSFKIHLFFMNFLHWIIQHVTLEVNGSLKWQTGSFQHGYKDTFLPHLKIKFSPCVIKLIIIFCLLIELVKLLILARSRDFFCTELVSFSLSFLKSLTLLRCSRYCNVLILENDWVFNRAHLIHLKRFISFNFFRSMDTI